MLGGACHVLQRDRRRGVVGVSNKVVATHQSPSPLCEADKSSLADLPESARVGYETARSEDLNYRL